MAGSLWKGISMEGPEKARLHRKVQRALLGETECHTLSPAPPPPGQRGWFRILSSVLTTELTANQVRLCLLSLHIPPADEE